MSGFRDFREIAGWRLSRDVRTLAYRLLAKRAVATDFKFRDQLRDAARSAPRNIAEGFARYKHKEFAQFARIATGSLAEVLDHFIDAVDNGYLTPAEFAQHEHACKKALKAVNGLIRYLESTPDPPKKKPKPPSAPSARKHANAPYAPVRTVRTLFRHDNRDVLVGEE
jgi:four helix bundle protein